MATMADTSIREAKASDCDILVSLMRDSANEQQLQVSSELTAEDLERDGFRSSPIFKMYVSQGQDGQIMGYLLYHYAFSAVIGRTAFVADIFVIPSHRRKGIASALWKKLTQTALSHGCLRCDVYKKAPNRFCLNRGAVDITETGDELVFKIEKEAMENFIRNFKSLDGFELRKAKKSDCPAIRESIQELYEYLKTPVVDIDVTVLEKEGYGDQPYYKAHVVEKDGILVGYATFFYTYHLDGIGVFMDDLYVSAEYRGKRIGAALWGRVMEESLDMGGRSCNFTVAAYNTGGMKFYKQREAIDTTERDGFHFYKFTKDVLEKCAKA